MTCCILQIPEEHRGNVFGWSKMFYEKFQSLIDSYKWTVTDTVKQSAVALSVVFR